MTRRAIAFSQADTTGDMFIVSVLLIAVARKDGFADEPFNPSGSEEDPTGRREHVSVVQRQEDEEEQRQQGSGRTRFEVFSCSHVSCG